MTPEQRRVLAALRDGAVMTARMNRYPVLKESGKRARAIRTLQPLWDAQLVTFKMPLSEKTEIILTEKGRRALAEAEEEG